MDAKKAAEDGDVCEDIMKHIHECDRMYREIYGKSPEHTKSHACRKLMKMGFYLNSTNMPDLCIQHCERWKMPSDEPNTKPPAGLPTPLTSINPR